MSALDTERECTTGAVSSPHATERPALPLLVVAMLLAGSALFGAALAMDRPAQGQAVLPASAFVIPWTGYMERDGLPHTGVVQMRMTVADQGGSGQSAVEFAAQSVTVRDGRFSLVVQPNEVQRASLENMVSPVMSLRVGTQELFGARPLRVAQSALQSGSARTPSFEQGVSVAGASRVSSVDVSGALDVTGGGTVVVNGDVAAQSAEVTGGLRVGGAIATVGGLHLVNPSNSTISATGSALRFTHAGDIPLLTLNADGATLASRLLIGRSDPSQVSGGNGALHLAANRFRLQGNELSLTTGRTHTLRGGPSDRGVLMAGGVEFDGRFPKMRYGLNDGTFYDYFLGAWRGSGNNRRTRTLASVDDHLCVLTGMQATHEHTEYSCEVQQVSGDWQLVAHIPNPRTGGAYVGCRAMCLYLGGL